MSPITKKEQKVSTNVASRQVSKLNIGDNFGANTRVSILILIPLDIITIFIVISKKK